MNLSVERSIYTSHQVGKFLPLKPVLNLDTQANPGKQMV